MLNTKQKAFTLVELIVVVTILAILATIGFVSYSSYLIGVRDTNRLSQMVSISDGIELYNTKSDLPIPDDNVEVLSNSEVIAYQGYAGANILELIDFTKGGKDPKDDEYFSYYLSRDRKSYQLLSFLEEPLAGSSTTTNSNGRIATVYGDKIGIVLDDNGIPIHKNSSIQSAGQLDIDTLPAGYTAVVSATKTFDGTVFHSLNQIVREGGYLESLELWYDMETDDGSGEMLDLTGNSHNASKSFSAITYGDSTGVYGNATSFNNPGGLIVPYFPEMADSEKSYSLWVKTDDSTLAYSSFLNQWDCTTTCNSTGGEWWFGYTGTDKNPYVIIGDTERIKSGIQNYDIPFYGDSQWHHHVLTISEGLTSLYIDGKFVASQQADSSMNFNSPIPLYIGTSGHTLTISSLTGYLDDFRMYTKALSPAEVKNIYMVGKKNL